AAAAYLIAAAPAQQTTNARPTRKSICLSFWSLRNMSGSLPATLAKARLPYVCFSAGLINSARYRRWQVTRCGSFLRSPALASASIPWLGAGRGYDPPRAPPAQGVPPQRGGIVRQYDQRDEDIFGVAEGAFTCADAACGGNELEAVSTEQACHLAVTLPAGEHQRAAQDGKFVKIRARGEIAHQLLERKLGAHQHLPRPRKR